MLEIIFFAFVNLENNAPNYPGLHTYGVRKSTKKRRNVYGEVFVTEVKLHCWEQWRETETQLKFQLKFDRVFKIGNNQLCLSENQ